VAADFACWAGIGPVREMFCASVGMLEGSNENPINAIMKAVAVKRGMTSPKIVVE
jgi:hypothetical protein